MKIKERLEEDLKTALKSGDKTAVSVIRLTLSDIKNAEIERRRSLEEGEVVQLLRSAVKKRKEAIDLFRRGGRPDLVDRETAELNLLEGYRPASLSREEITALVEEGVNETKASSLRDLGRVMKWIVPRLEGRADGAQVSQLVRERLGPESSQ